MSEENKQSTPSKAAAKSTPEITYSQVMTKARSLCDSGKLTYSWMVEKLQEEDKKPSDYKESDLKKLDAELDAFMEELEAAQTAQ